MHTFVCINYEFYINALLMNPVIYDIYSCKHYYIIKNVLILVWHNGK